MAGNINRMTIMLVLFFEFLIASKLTFNPPCNFLHKYVGSYLKYLYNYILKTGHIQSKSIGTRHNGKW